MNFNTISSLRAPKYQVEKIVKSQAWCALEKHSPDPDLFFKISGIRENATVACHHDMSVAIDCTSEPCVFDLEVDPCEQNNLAQTFPDILASLEEQVEKYKFSGVPVIKFVSYDAANPEYFNGTWSIWEI